MAWEHNVVAFNTATESANRMHDDAVAASYGFHGGLVPGVDVWAYLTRPCVERWGLEFLRSGEMYVRFERPVYDGEEVSALLAEDGTLALLGPDGASRATGRAALGGRPRPEPVSVGRAPCPTAARGDLAPAGGRRGLTVETEVF